MPLLGEAEEFLQFFGWQDVARDEYIFPIMPGRIRSGMEEALRAREKKTALHNKHLKELA